jgi:hypothetical protein
VDRCLGAGYAIAMNLDDPIVGRVVAFLEAIGIPVAIEPLPEDGLLPGMTVRHGSLVIDPARPAYPGDLLHEAGHIAVSDPAARGGLDAIVDDPGEEMAAICWSYAAALEIGIDPAIVFHDDGYRGGGAWLAETFGAGSYIGLPLLQYYGMTADEKTAAARGVPAYPAMHRWLR